MQPCMGHFQQLKFGIENHIAPDNTYTCCSDRQGNCEGRIESETIPVVTTRTNQGNAGLLDIKFHATCAGLQVEGAWNESGRSPSVWDTLAHTPGASATRSLLLQPTPQPHNPTASATTVPDSTSGSAYHLAFSCCLLPEKYEVKCALLSPSVVALTPFGLGPWLQWHVCCRQKVPVLAGVLLPCREDCRQLHR